MRPYKHPEPKDLTIERVLHALSDPVRLDLVRHLARKPEASCSELNGDRPKSSMSHHYRVLRDAGLLRTEVSGTTHQNTLRRAELDERFPGLLKSILQAK